MNGDAPQQLNIPLSFLKDAKYKVSVVKDSPDSTGTVKIEEAAYTQKDVIPLQLAPGGGYVAMFVTASGGNVYNTHNTTARRKDE